MAPTHAKTPAIKSAGSKYNQKRSRELRCAAIAPIIKIVHVYAPTLVRTDVANFRALVQEMTGNDTTNSCDCNIKDMRKASTINETRDKEKPEVKTASVQPHVAHSREGGEEGKEEKGGKGERQIMLERAWDGRSVHEYGYFGGESEEACMEDYLYKMQQQYRSSAYFTNWRQPVAEIPDSFGYF